MKLLFCLLHDLTWIFVLTVSMVETVLKIMIKPGEIYKLVNQDPLSLYNTNNFILNDWYLEIVEI